MEITWLDLVKLAGDSLTELKRRSGYSLPYVREQLVGTRPMTPRLKEALDEMRVAPRAIERARAILARSPRRADRAVARLHEAIQGPAEGKTEGLLATRIEPTPAQREARP